MGERFCFGLVGAVCAVLTAGLIWFNWAAAPVPVPLMISSSLGSDGAQSPPLLYAYPDLEGVSICVNTATEEELTQLPGIGVTRAKAICDYRNTAGPLEQLEQLLEVKGIGEKTLEQIRPYLTLEETESRSSEEQ